MTARRAYPTAAEIQRVVKATAAALHAQGVRVGGVRLGADGSVVVLSERSTEVVQDGASEWDRLLEDDRPAA